ncbi:MAG TPA: DUF5666 domain-containing protein [Blastocatellia bacterium]|nr:DUF5666 domain-containing protein [Blastocatellia bacterium]
MRIPNRNWLRPAYLALFAVAVMLFGLMPKGSAAMFDGNDNRPLLVGTITTLPAAQNFVGDWVIFRTKVKVTDTTKLDQTRAKIAVGALVEVKGTKQNDGSITATEITVKLAAPPGFPITFGGKIDELPSTANRVGDWKVNGKVVHVSASTKLIEEKGKVAVGVFVEVDGLVQLDGSINASEIEVKPDGVAGIPTKFTGKIEKLPSTQGRIGEWVISGRKVNVTAQTLLKATNGDFMIGSTVDVEGVIQNDGSIIATKLESKASPTPPTIFVYFVGTIEALPNTTTFIGDWKISGRAVKVTDKTDLRQDKGKIAVGSIVEVSGTMTADVVTALKIAVREDNLPDSIRFTGIVATLPPSNGTVPGFIGDWKVGERTVHVGVQTKVDESKAKVTVGALVEVVGTQRADRSIDATSIVVKDNVPGGPISYVRFFGSLTKLPDVSIQIGNGRAGDWIVGGKTVHVEPRTRINEEHGRAAVGAYLEVEGNQRADGSVDAAEITVERDATAPAGTVGYMDFYGPIRTLPSAANLVGVWMVDGKTVNVSSTTKLEKGRVEFAAGVIVEVKGYLLGNGQVNAIKIEGKVPASNSNVVTRSYIEFIGDVTALPTTANFVGDWKVGGRTVHVKERTLVRRERAAVTVGATVEIYGVELSDGTVDAKFIEVSHGPVGASFQAFASLASVNAGSYLEGATSSAIIASFGSGLAGGVEVAKSLPLPTELGGVSVLIDGDPAGLFFVSPGQINYQVPEDTLPGAAQVTVMKNGQAVAQGTLELGNVGPSLFTADSSGTGVPAGVLLRVRANGQQSYEPLSTITNGKITPVTIARNAGDRLFLVLYGTGWRGADDTDGNAANGVAESLEVTIGNAKAPVLFAGEAPGFAGLDQMNVEIPAGVSGSVTLAVKVYDGEGNVVRTNSVSISIK